MINHSYHQNKFYIILFIISAPSPFQKWAYTNESLVIHYPQTPAPSQILSSS